jgi:hypothetical protein
MKVGRNDRCPCGSGAKYKRCCLDREGDRSVDEGDARPTAIEGLAARQEELAERLRARPDRYAQLLGHGFTRAVVGMEMRSASTLTEQERAEMEALAPAAFASYRTESNELVRNLRRLVGQADPLHVIAWVKAANLLAAPGSYYEPTFRGLESSVELVSGLLLTQPASSELDAPSPRLLSEINEHLTRLQDVLLLRNFAAPRGDDQVTADLRFSGALHWMSLRGTSYEHHGAELAEGILRPFDDICRKRYGFTADDALKVGRAEEERSTARLNAALDQAHAVADEFRAKAADPRHRSMLSAEAVARLDEPGVSDRFAFAAFQSVLAEHLADANTFEAEDLVSEDLSLDTIGAVLAELSIRVGELTEDDYHGPFDVSPLVHRPFVEFEGRYILPVPGMVLRDTLSLFERRLLRDVRSFSASRAKALDALAVKYLTDVLPASRPFTNLHYGGNELDGLVLFERTAILVEGKGTPLSPAAQRGDVERLKRDVTKAVEDAWRQGKRAREYLLTSAPAIFTDDRGREILRVQPGEVDAVIVVNPTLHQLAGHASQLHRLRALGLFADDEYPWSVFINDLRVISETAGNAAVFLHYLTWRSRLPLGDRLLVGDEIDLWASYLLCDRFRGLADGGHHMVGNASTDFDAYYNGLLGNGPPSPKPAKMLAEPLRSFVERMAVERPAGWLEAAGTCLDLSIVELAYVNARAKVIAEAAQSEGDVVIEEAGRVRLIGMPRGRSIEDTMAESDGLAGDAIFHIYVRASLRRVATEWAKTIGRVTHEPSDQEERFYRELAERS